MEFSSWSGLGCHFLLQGIFLTQRSNPGLLHCRQILYLLNHEGSPNFLLLRIPVGNTSNYSVIALKKAGLKYKDYRLILNLLQNMTLTINVFKGKVNSKLMSRPYKILRNFSLCHNFTLKFWGESCLLHHHTPRAWLDAWHILNSIKTWWMN